MQIVYISNRPDIFRATLAYVRAFMPFIGPCLVICPAEQRAAFARIDPAVAVLSEQELLGDGSAAFRAAADHQRRDYILRAGLARHDAVADVFIMSDDDYRPLRPIEEGYFLSAGKCQPFFFYSLDQWKRVIPRRHTSYDTGNLNTLDLLRERGFGTLLFSSHMPQIVDKRLFGLSV